MPGEYKQQVACGLPEVTPPCAFCHQRCCCEVVAAIVGAHGHILAGSKLQAAAFYKQYLTEHGLEETNLAELHDPGVQKDEAAVPTAAAAAAAAAANTADRWHRCWTVDAVDGPLYYETHSRLVDTQKRSHGPENLVPLVCPPSKVCARQIMSYKTTAHSGVCVSSRLP